MQEETVDTGKMTAYNTFREVLELTRPVDSIDMSTVIDAPPNMNVNDDDDSPPSCPLNLMNLVRAIQNIRFPSPSRHLSRLSVNDVYDSLAEIIGIQGEDSHWNTCDRTTLFVKQQQVLYLLGQYGYHGRSAKHLAMAVKYESIVKMSHDEWRRIAITRSNKRKLDDCIHLTVLSMSPQKQYETHVIMASKDGYHSCVTGQPQGQIKTTKYSVVQGEVDAKVNETINLVLQNEKRKLFLGLKGIKKVKKNLAKVRTAMGFGRKAPIKHIDGDYSNPVVADGVPVLEGIAI
jgi:hypothetical protein